MLGSLRFSLFSTLLLFLQIVLALSRSKEIPCLFMDLTVSSQVQTLSPISVQYQNNPSLTKTEQKDPQQLLQSISHHFMLIYKLHEVKLVHAPFSNK